ARRQIPDAAALSVLQVLAWADRNTPARQVRPKDIATTLGVHRSAVTHQLQALEEAGQVSLTVDSADRRSWLVALTDTRRPAPDAPALGPPADRGSSPSPTPAGPSWTGSPPSAWTASPPSWPTGTPKRSAP